MKKPTPLILAAWILHAAAWFLPTLKAQDFRPAVPGWKATRLAACAIWPCGDVQFQTVHHAVLATVSVATTLFFVLCSPWVVLRGSQSLRRWSAWVAVAAFVFNMHWIVIFLGRSGHNSRLDTSYGCYRSSYWASACSCWRRTTLIALRRRTGP
jgi:hypothetical protein